MVTLRPSGTAGYKRYNLITYIVVLVDCAGWQRHISVITDRWWWRFMGRVCWGVGAIVVPTSSTICVATVMSVGSLAVRDRAGIIG